MAESSPTKTKGQVKGCGNHKTKQFNCEICEKTIIDKHPGEEAVLCKGSCQSWLHRRCAGLPTKHFKLLSDSSEPFRCYICCQKSFREELQQLHAKVSNLETKLLSSIPKQNDITTAQQQIQQPSPVLPNITTAANNPSLPPQQPIDLEQPTTPRVKQTYSNAISKNLNVVMYGVAENPKGTPQSDRIEHDLTKKICPSISSDPIVDCQ